MASFVYSGRGSGGGGLTSPVLSTQGGTGITTYTTGDILYASATNVLSKLGIGSTGQVLKVVGGIPAWSGDLDTGITQLTGDATAGPGSGSQALTLATVNSNVGSFTFASITVNAKGLVTAASSGATPATTALSNLASVAVNTAILPGTTDSIGLGSQTKRWGTSYISAISDTSGIAVINCASRTLRNTSADIVLDFSGTTPYLGTLTSNGFVKTSGSTGALSIDTSTYLTTNQTITLSGDVTGSGNTSITATISGLDFSKLASLATGHIIAGNGGVATDVTVSGDVTIGATGVTAIGSGKVTNAMLAGSIDLAAKVTGLLPLANGGTNKNMTAAAGGIVWTDADSMEVSAAGSSGQVLISGGTGAPTWASGVGFGAYRATNQTGINPNNTEVQISIDTTTAGIHGYDPQSGFASNTYTVPAGQGGIWVVSASINIGSTNVLANLYEAVIYINGAAAAYGGSVRPAVTTGFDAAITSQFNLAAGDTIKLYLYGAGNNSSSTITATGGAALTWFTAYKAR